MNIERLMNYFYQICTSPSITETPEEKHHAKEIYKLLKQIPYFKSNPEYAVIHPIKADKNNRSFITGFIKHPQNYSKTVIIYAHYDVVGVEEFGVLKDYAFDPITYTKKLKENKVSLNKEVQEDLDSGEWLFGRGTMDMKFGLATCLEILNAASEHPEILDGNLLFLGVCDEEGNSTGMLAALPYLKELKVQFNLSYSGVIVTEPYMAPDEKSHIPRLHVGSVGKLLPIFYCVGHTGHIFNWNNILNPNLIISKIVEKLEQNPIYCDEIEGHYSPAPVCLKQADCKNEYTVQTPVSAYTYFNLMTYQRNPDTVLKEMVNLATIAMDEAIDTLEKNRIAFKNISGTYKENKHFKTNVLTYQELFELCTKTHGNTFKAHMTKFLQKQNNVDNRIVTLAAIAEAHRFCPDRNPMVIIAFAPPYYPNTYKFDKTGSFANHLKQFVQYADEKYGKTFMIDPTFNGISDMSYLNIRDDIDVKTIENNLPLWGIKYELPIDLMKELAIPYVCIGAYGKDAHQYTERLHLPFATQIAAPATWDLVQFLLK